MGVLKFLITVVSRGLHLLLGNYNTCRFKPSCSAYMYESIERLGFLKGFRKGLFRIARCNPWGGQGFDPVEKERLV